MDSNIRQAFNLLTRNTVFLVILFEKRKNNLFIRDMLIHCIQQHKKERERENIYICIQNISSKVF